MQFTKRQLELQQEMQQDFAESVFAEELDFDTVPAELLAEFGDAPFVKHDNLIPDEDFWGSEGLKQQRKR